MSVSEPQSGDASAVSAETPAAQDVSTPAAQDFENESKVVVVLERLNKPAPQGWFLSAFLHIVSYFIAVQVFYALGMHLIEDESVEAVQLSASLGDETVIDDSAKLEIIQDISSGNTNSPSSLEQLARHLNASNRANELTLDTDVLEGFSQTENGQEPGGSGAGFMFKMPESGLAVTKGSFTAWTDPANPAPRQNYLIIIEIQLPSSVTRYQLSDLNGSSIRGSDSYQQRIPFDVNAAAKGYGTTANGRPPLLKVSDELPIVNNKVQLVVKVPGARRLVKDTIRIKSRRLREEEELTIIFGRSAPGDSEPETPEPANDSPDTTDSDAKPLQSE